MGAARGPRAHRDRGGRAADRSTAGPLPRRVARQQPRAAGPSSGARHRGEPPAAAGRRRGRAVPRRARPCGRARDARSLDRRFGDRGRRGLRGHDRAPARRRSRRLPPSRHRGRRRRLGRGRGRVVPRPRRRVFTGRARVHGPGRAGRRAPPSRAAAAGLRRRAFRGHGRRPLPSGHGRLEARSAPPARAARGARARHRPGLPRFGPGGRALRRRPGRGQHRGRGPPLARRPGERGLGRQRPASRGRRPLRGQPARRGRVRRPPFDADRRAGAAFSLAPPPMASPSGTAQGVLLRGPSGCSPRSTACPATRPWPSLPETCSSWARLPASAPSPTNACAGGSRAAKGGCPIPGSRPSPSRRTRSTSARTAAASCAAPLLPWTPPRAAWIARATNLSSKRKA